MSNIADSDFDLIIIGGGLAGASLACALKDIEKDVAKDAGSASLKIAVVEAYELNTQLQPSYDDRTVALSYGSRCIFETMGLWSALAEHAQAIDTIHISDRGHFGVTRLTKEQEDVEALGYVLENKRVGQVLYSALDKNIESNVSLFCPAKIVSLQQDKNQVSVEITMDGGIKDGGTKQLHGKLLVAADGSNSKVMQLLNIGRSQKNYNQTALITNITPSKKHNNVAYERFTETGPLAFLPMQSNRCSVVWTLQPKQAEELLALDDANFLSQLQERFGFRLGQFTKVGMRQIYPLALQAATQTVHDRVLVIGNAAHSLHPVAGQGFNLALRDIAILSELIVDSVRSAVDIGQQAMLQEYAQLREQDIKRVYRFTDTLVKTFSNNISVLGHVRSLSLLVTDVLPDIKHQLAKQSMGLSGRLSRLNRGLRL
jgi:2-octaprenyl-6-methoxyphenol hydroxylase